MLQAEKKTKRLENKKRKLAALINVIRLNEQDTQQNELVMESENSSSDSDRLSGVEQSKREEPTTKRHKSLSYATHRTNITNEVDSVPTVPKQLTMEEYAQLKLELHQRKIFLTRLPRIRIRDDGLKATIDTAPCDRIPLFMKDIQHMLVYFLFGPYLKPYNSSPRWCIIEKFTRIGNVTCMVFEGLSLDDFVENKDQFHFLNQFTNKVDVISSFSYDGNIVSDLSAVSLSDNDRASLLKKFGNEDGVLKNDAKVFSVYKPAFPVDLSPAVNNKSVADKFPRTFLLLSLWQMVVENYPVPIRGELSSRYANYRMTKEVYKEVSDDSPLYAVDCEMCLTTANENELTRITVVNEKSEVVYESLVKPHNRIVNYLTKFSGITEKMLENVDKRIEDVQDDLIKLLPADAILVGHSLNTDLHAIKMMHPYVIDTSVIFNISGERWRKPKLQTLAWEFLGLRIQSDAKGHDSAEDSISSLKLVQLKLSRDISFGDAVMVGKQHLTDKEINPVEGEKEQKNGPSLATSVFNSLIHDKKSSIVISTEEIIQSYRRFVTAKDETDNCRFISESSKKNIIKRSCVAINQSKFTLVHVPIVEDDKQKCLSRVDKWCSKLWKSAKENSACVVIFAGSSTAISNAVCFVETKRPYVPPRKPRLDS